MHFPKSKVSLVHASQTKTFLFSRVLNLVCAEGKIHSFRINVRDFLIPLQSTAKSHFLFLESHVPFSTAIRNLFSLTMPENVFYAIPTFLCCSFRDEPAIGCPSTMTASTTPTTTPTTATSPPGYSPELLQQIFG